VRGAEVVIGECFGGLSRTIHRPALCGKREEASKAKSSDRTTLGNAGIPARHVAAAEVQLEFPLWRFVSFVLFC
jgi:hypothetical protein